MIRNVFAAVLLALLAACAAVSVTPDDCTRNGGVGGTGGCPQSQTN